MAGYCLNLIKKHAFFILLLYGNATWKGLQLIVEDILLLFFYRKEDNLAAN